MYGRCRTSDNWHATESCSAGSWAATLPAVRCSGTVEPAGTPVACALCLSRASRRSPVSQDNCLESAIGTLGSQSEFLQGLTVSSLVETILDSPPRCRV